MLTENALNIQNLLSQCRLEHLDNISTVLNLNAEQKQLLENGLISLVTDITFICTHPPESGNARQEKRNGN